MFSKTVSNLEFRASCDESEIVVSTEQGVETAQQPESQPNRATLRSSDKDLPADSIVVDSL